MSGLTFAAPTIKFFILPPNDFLTLFFTIGFKKNGIDFIPNALKNGAKALSQAGYSFRSQSHHCDLIYD